MVRGTGLLASFPSSPLVTVTVVTVVGVVSWRLVSGSPPYEAWTPF